MLLCWSVTLWKFIQTLDHNGSSHYRNENRLVVWGILDWSSWILTECNLSWKIVKYPILSETETNWNYKITKNNYNKFVIMLKHNSIKVHSNTRPKWQLALEMRWPCGWFWKFFERFRQKPTIDRPEYWLSAICFEKLWNTAFCSRSVW